MFHPSPKLFNFLLEIGKSSIFYKLSNFTRPLYFLAHFPYKVHPLSHFPYKVQVTSQTFITLFFLVKFPKFIHRPTSVKKLTQFFALSSSIVSFPTETKVKTISFFEFIHQAISLYVYSLSNFPKNIKVLYTSWKLNKIPSEDE